MNRLNPLSRTFSIALTLLVTVAYSQVAGPAADPTYTTEKKRLLVLPAQENDTTGIQLEVTETVVSAAVSLGRFEIIDRNHLADILLEQNLAMYGLIDDSSAVSFGKIASAGEALLVSVLNFGQQGVPDNSDERDDDEDDAGGFLARLIAAQIMKEVFEISNPLEWGQKTDPWSHNIQTQITVQVKNIDVETSETLYSFLVDASHTGGSASKSRATAMNTLRARIEAELRAFYRLGTEVLSVDGNELLIPLGSELGLRPGMVFRISEPDRIESFGERSITVPGDVVGYARIHTIGNEAGRAAVIRRWDDIQPGYQVSERIKPMVAGKVEILPAVPEGKSVIGLGVTLGAAGPFVMGVGIGYAMIEDSRDETVGGINLSLSGGLRPSYARKNRFVVKSTIDVAFLFKSDDEGHLAYTAAPSINFGGELELLSGPHRDWLIGLGYRIGVPTDRWFYSESDDDSDQTLKAVWNGAAPEINPTGPYLTLGTRFILP